MAADASSIAKAYVQIMPSAKGIKEMLDKEMGGPAAKAGHTAGHGIAGGIKKAIAAAGIGAALGKALGQGMELEQNLGGTEAVFGKFAKDIQQTAAAAFKNMGTSASEYMATANKMGSLFQGSGIAQAEAVELSTKAMQRAADVASVMGIDMSMAMESVAGAAKGNFTMMDNLGVAMNATNIQAYALEKGINFKWNTATQAEKTRIAMEMFFDRTSQYAGNFAKESETTLAGSMEAVKAAFSNVLGNLTLGQDIGPALADLADTTTTFLVSNLLPAVWNIIKALPGALVTFIKAAGPQMAQGFMSFIPELQTSLSGALPQLVTFAQQLVSQFCTGFPTAFPKLLQAGSAMLTKLVDGILVALPQLLQCALTLLESYLGTLIANLPQILQTGSEMLTSLISGIASNFPQLLVSAAQVILNLVQGLVNNFPDILSAGFDLIVSLISGIGNAFPDIIDAAGEIVSKIWDTITETDWLELGKDVIRGLINGLLSMGSALWEAAKSIANSVKDSIMEHLKIGSPSRVMRDEVGKWIPAGLALGITGNAAPVRKAMAELAALATDGVPRNVAMRMQPAFSATPAYAGGYGQTVFNQTIYTHDSLSESELTREAEDMFARQKWGLP